MKKDAKEKAAQIAVAATTGEQHNSVVDTEIITNKGDVSNTKPPGELSVNDSCPSDQAKRSDLKGLEIMSMTELYDNSFPPKLPVIDGLLNCGTYLFVGAPKIGQDYDLYKKGDDAEGHGPGKQSQCTVNIGGAGKEVIIGSPTNYQIQYGGEVYGASRGDASLNANQYGSVVWTKVKVLDGAYIQGNVFGGGDNGMVKKDTDVKIGE